jgi:hypothetical protein
MKHALIHPKGEPVRFLGVALVISLQLVALTATGQTPASPGSPAPPAAPPRAPPPQAAPSPAAPPAESTSAADGWTQRFDRLWPQREDPKVLDEVRNLARAQQAKDPKDYDASWRLASVFVWEADGLPDGDPKAEVAKQAWEIAEKAVEVRPKEVQGQYYAGTGLGLYSEGVGILTALRQGLEGKFRSYSLAALRINRDFLDGAPLVLWGRYFFKLPWPKRDVGQSIKVLTNCLVKHPANLRAKLYLAEALLSDDKKAEAKKQLAEIAAAPIGTDPSEDHRMKDRAAQFAKEHQKDLM